MRANIRLRSIQNNAKAFKSITKTKLCAVVKADAYGHGIVETVCALEGIADCFAVSLLDEAIVAQTAACGKDILILTPPLTEQDVYFSAKRGFVLTVDSLPTARLVLLATEKYRLFARVHLKVNTGMNRYGLSAKTLKIVCECFYNNARVSVEGLYSHLYQTEAETAEKQRTLFLQMREVCLRYFKDAVCHLSATYGALLGERFAFDMVRIGIGLYGYLPTDSFVDGMRRPKLQKAMTVWAQVSASARYSFGGAGYGKAKRKLSKGDRLYVCRYGYADGFLRKRKNGVFGWRKQANNICMDACVRKGASKRGEWVKILSDADETARLTGTISYEVLCAATRRAERVYEYE